MKIGIFVHGYLPWDVYGIPRYVERLSKYLSNTGHKVWIITRGNSYLKKKEKINDNLTIYRTFHLNLKKISRLTLFKNLWDICFYSIMALIEGIRLIKKNKIEILHGHHFEYGGLQAIVIGKLLKKRTLITIHGPGTLKNILKNNYLAVILEYLLKSCNNIIVNNNESYNVIKNLNFDISKLILISNGVNINKFKRNNELRLKLRKELNIEANEIVILYLGRLDYFHGAIIFIEAIERIKANNNIKILICGTGPLSDIIRKYSLEMSSKVIYVGYTNNPYIYHNISDIFINPSPIESFPSLSMLESMSIGNICLITETLDSRKYFTEDEVFFIKKPVNAEQITKLLNEIIANIKYYRIMGDMVSEKIKKDFNQEVIFKKIANLYKNRKN